MGTYTLNGSSALTYLRAQNLKLGVADQLNHQALFAALLVSMQLLRALHYETSAFLKRIFGKAESDDCLSLIGKLRREQMSE